jgi:hypothetical protein
VHRATGQKNRSPFDGTFLHPSMPISMRGVRAEGSLKRHLNPRVTATPESMTKIALLFSLEVTNYGFAAELKVSLIRLLQLKIVPHDH